MKAPAPRPRTLKVVRKAEAQSLVEILLRSEQGISLAGYNALADLFYELVPEPFDKADACDDTFYLCDPVIVDSNDNLEH